MSLPQLAQSSSDLLASFSDDTDVAQWINDLLDNSLPPRDGHGDVSELATRLEVACQDTSSQLEQSIDDISRTVPRLTYDLHFLRESALSLKASLASLQARISSSMADGETTQALQRLSYLDTVKTRMEAARDVLREAESWSTLEPEVTALLAEPHYEKAAERLADASRSMVVFQNTPEYEARRALMVSLQNQLEASLSSALVAAINARDVASCKNYYAIFAHIQRESEFRNYYNGSRRGAVVQLWKTAALADVEGEAPQTDESPAKFPEFLSRFFADFLALVNEERTYAPSIFPDPQQTLSTLVQSTIDALTPSLSQRLSGLSEHYGPTALSEFIEAFRAAEKFAVETDKALEKLAYATLFSSQKQPPQADEASKAHSRRLSKRMSMSMSRRYGPARSSISGNIFTSGGAWEQALFEPFVDFQADYESLEKKHLDHALGLVISMSHQQADTDRAREFRERSANVFAMAEECLGHCMDFTHGYGMVGMLRALDHVFSSFLASSRTELLTSQDTASALISEGVPSDAFEGLDYSANDWGTIQLALHLLEASRVVRERLGILERQVRTTLVHVASTFRLARNDPQNLYIPNTTRGEAQLLSQSTLNSAELQTLIDNLDPGGTNSSAVSTEAEQSVRLLSGAWNATVEFTKACQGVLQETLLAPMLHHLSTYGSSPVWSATTESNKTSRDLGIPTFSLSPTSTMQRIAEGLLNLPRLFEVYAEDDALAFSVETLPFVDAASLRAVLAPSPASEPQSRSPVETHIRRLSTSHAFSTPPPQRVLPPEMIVSAWLSSLALSLLSHLTAKVLPAIRTLSVSGAAQLASDLGYLSNIVRALNVEWAELEQWKEAAEMTEDVWRQKAKEEAGAEDAFHAIARIRGWT